MVVLNCQLNVNFLFNWSWWHHFYGICWGFFCGQVHHQFLIVFKVKRVNVFQFSIWCEFWTHISYKLEVSFIMAKNFPIMFPGKWKTSLLFLHAHSFYLMHLYCMCWHCINSLFCPGGSEKSFSFYCCIDSVVWAYHWSSMRNSDIYLYFQSSYL